MKHLKTFGQINESNEDDSLWLSIITKFYTEFYPEYSDYEPEDHINDNEIESNQTMEKNTGGKYDQSYSFEDALDTFKKNLTDDEAAMIEISTKDEEYADVEDHDYEKEFTTVKIKKK